MKITCKQTLVVTFLIFCCALSGCATSEEAQKPDLPPMTFEAEKTQCRHSPEIIRFEGDTVHFSGTLVVGLTSNVIDLEATLEMNKSADDSAYRKLIVKLIPINNSEMDIENDQDSWHERYFSFTGAIGPLDYGSYDVKIIHGTWTLAEQRIEYSVSKLIFQSFNGSCTTNDDSTINVSLWNGNLTFNGSAITPNPCYDLIAEADLVSPSDLNNSCEITVNISAVSNLGEGEACIKCIGSVPFSGEFGPLEPGVYNVSFVYNGNVIAKQSIERHMPEFGVSSTKWCCAEKNPFDRREEPSAAICVCDGEVLTFAYMGEASDSCTGLDAVLMPIYNGDYPQKIIVQLVSIGCEGPCMMVITPLGCAGTIQQLDPGEYDIQIRGGGNQLLAQQDVVIQ